MDLLDKMRTSAALPASVLVALSLLIASCSGPKTESVNFPLIVRKESEFRTPATAVGVAWSPDGSRLAAAFDWGSKVVVWDKFGRKLSEFAIPTPQGGNLNGSIAFLAGSSQVLLEYVGAGGSDVALTVHDAASGRLIRNVIGPNPGGGIQNLTSGFKVSPDQRLVALEMALSGPKGIDVAIIDARDGKFLRGYPIEKGPISLSFFAKGQQLAVGSIDGISTILDATTTGPPRQFQAAENTQATRGNVTTIAGSPDGELIFLGQAARDVAGGHVLRAKDGVRVANFPLAPNQFFRWADWDPKGRYVAFLDGYEGLVLWRPLATSPSYDKISVSAQSMSFAISPDGDHIAVAGPVGVVIYSVH